MTNRKIKFLPIFLISIACLIASVGFTGVNAHAENCDSANNGEHTITFKAASGNGHIEGPTEYKCYGDCGPVSQANESTLKMFEFGPMVTIEIKAVPSCGSHFVVWTRSDEKDFDADINTDVEFVAHFEFGKLDPEMKDFSPQKAYYYENSSSKSPKDCYQVIFRKSKSNLIAESSHEGIASVSIVKTCNDEDAVLIKGHKIGKTTITVTSTEDDTYKSVSKSFDVDVFGEIIKPFVLKKPVYDGAHYIGVLSSKYVLDNEYYTFVNPTRDDGVITEIGYAGSQQGVYGIYAKLKPGYVWMDDEDRGDIYCEFKVV
ncbi:MAG: hypothetical protein Q4E88_03905 [Coriobacteriia bacterium]|nr:hypothetical protein [Coriobacteriia bacterium]